MAGITQKSCLSCVGSIILSQRMKYWLSLQKGILATTQSFETTMELLYSMRRLKHLLGNWRISENLVCATWWANIYLIQKQLLEGTYSFFINIVHQMFCSKYICALTIIPFWRNSHYISQHHLTDSVDYYCIRILYQEDYLLLTWRKKPWHFY